MVYPRFGGRYQWLFLLIETRLLIQTSLDQWNCSWRQESCQQPLLNSLPNLDLRCIHIDLSRHFIIWWPLWNSLFLCIAVFVLLVLPSFGGEHKLHSLYKVLLNKSFYYSFCVFVFFEARGVCLMILFHVLNSSSHFHVLPFHTG